MRKKIPFGKSVLTHSGKFGMVLKAIFVKCCVFFPGVTRLVVVFYILCSLNHVKSSRIDIAGWPSMVLSVLKVL